MLANGSGALSRPSVPSSSAPIKREYPRHIGGEDRGEMAGGGHG